jgi:hypothetical protein
VDAIYFGPGETPVDIIDGHFGDASFDDVEDDNATDILLVKGIDLNDDTIVVGEVDMAGGPRQLHFDYNGREILAPWRNAAGIPLVEQIRITGLGGDDHIEFLRRDDTTRNIYTVDTSYLTARGNDFVGHIEGGAGDDTLIGGNARDRIDGGRGSDTIFGYGGNDRLYGEKPTDSPVPIDTTTVDTIFGGQGNDDLIGGAGRNFLYAWSQDPKLGGQFGIFTDASGLLYDNDGDTDDDGVLDAGVTAVRALEDTGIDRMLGSAQDDELYGGTGPGFLFGNGGDDKLFRADGSLFESLDGGLGGDEWKDYAKEYSSVWYVAGSGADDRITVDYVTEPGLLRDYHLVTRLTKNGDVYSFAAQVRLDPTGLAAGGAFEAVDSDIETDDVEGRSSGVVADGANPDAALPTLEDINARRTRHRRGHPAGRGCLRRHPDRRPGRQRHHRGRPHGAEDRVDRRRRRRRRHHDRLGQRHPGGWRGGRLPQRHRDPRQAPGLAGQRRHHHGFDEVQQAHHRQSGRRRLVHLQALRGRPERVPRTLRHDGTGPARPRDLRGSRWCARGQRTARLRA